MVNLRKYFVMGTQDCPPNERPVEILQEAIEGGITVFQFREKGGNAQVGDDKVALAKELWDVCRQHGIPFIVNDDVALAESVGADGVHVGQDDMAVRAIRKQLPHAIIGLSISSMAELTASADALQFIDYIGAGPIYETTSKSDAQAAVGTEWIRTLKRIAPKTPIVGIGGIQTENAANVITAGADGVAVISAITQAADRQLAIKQL